LSHGADRGGLSQAEDDVIGRMATVWHGVAARRRQRLIAYPASR